MKNIIFITLLLVSSAALCEQKQYTYACNEQPKNDCNMILSNAYATCMNNKENTREACTTTACTGKALTCHQEKKEQKCQLNTPLQGC